MTECYIARFKVLVLQTRGYACIGGIGALEKKAIAASLMVAAAALAIGGCSPLAGSHAKAVALVAKGPWSARPTVAKAHTSTSTERAVAAPSSTPTQSATALPSSSPAPAPVIPTSVSPSASPSTPPPLSPAAAQVEHDCYALVGQTVMGGYPVVLGQNQSGDEELVETWPSALVTEEEVAQYINADTLLGLNPATVPGFNGGAHPQLDIWDVRSRPVQTSQRW